MEASQAARRRHDRKVMAHFTLFRPWVAGFDPEPAVSTLAADGYRVTWQAVENAMGPTLIMDLDDTTVVRDSVDLDTRTRSLCGSVEPQGYTVMWGRIVTPLERRKEEATARRMGAIFPDLPGTSDLDRYLKANWAGLRDRFFADNKAAYARVRDARCTVEQSTTTYYSQPFGRYYRCTVGVLATSVSGPEYEQQELEVEWGPSILYERDLREHDEQIILIN
jgi:hypothetical protein